MASQNRTVGTKKPKTAKTLRTISKKTASKTIKNKRSNKKASKASQLPIYDLKKLLPPLGSEAAYNQTANKEATDIVKAIYHDINTQCNFGRIAMNKDPLGQSIFSNLLASTEKFVEREITNYKACVESFKTEHGEFQPVAPNSRFFDFINELGWKIFAICAHAESFRRWLRAASDRVWGFVCGKIRENSFSIEVYAHSYDLKWRNVLWNYRGCSIPGLPGMKSVLETYMKWKVDHPHHTVITLDGKLKEPTWQGHLQENINENVFDPEKWNGRRDPTLRKLPNGFSSGVGAECFLCGSKFSCDCRLQSRTGEFVELIEYPKKGTGVRTLTDFKCGDILGIFVGELVREATEDWVYPLTQRNESADGLDSEVCTVAPHRLGNWTRYINHSCDSSTSFITRTIGKRVVTTIEAIRDIKPFEELTVHYGDDYWRSSGKKCLCGHYNCVSLGL